MVLAGDHDAVKARGRRRTDGRPTNRTSERATGRLVARSLGRSVAHSLACRCRSIELITNGIMRHPVESKPKMENGVIFYFAFVIVMFERCLASLTSRRVASAARPADADPVANTSSRE